MEKLSFILYYTYILIYHIHSQVLFGDSGIVNFTMPDSSTCQINSWVGIGFGTSMINTDMNILQVDSQGMFSLSDRFSKSHSTPLDDTSLGGTFDLANITQVGEVSNGSILVEYSRLLNTGDQYDQILSQGSNNLIVAWGTGQFAFHGSRYKITSFTLTYSNKTDLIESHSNITVAQPTTSLEFWDLHGISLIIFWTVFSFIGYFTGRFLKHYHWWIWVHIGSSGLAALYTVGIVIPAIYYAYESDEVVFSIHTIFGLIFFSLVGLQIISGSTVFFYIYLQNKVTRNDILHLKQYHKYSGILLTISSYINLITGFIIRYPLFVGIPSAFCAAIVGAIIVYELYTLHLNLHNKNVRVNELSENRINYSLLPKVKRTELKYFQEKGSYVIYDNLLIDISKFFKHHPGGFNLLSDNLYADVGRYLTGNQAYSPSVHSHSHSFSTLSHIISSLAFASLHDEHHIFFNSSGKSIYINGQASLVGKSPVTSNVSEFKFQITPRGFDSPACARFIPGYDWLGRHIKLTSKNLNKSRYYSICLGLNELIKEKHVSLMENISNFLQNRQLKNVKIAEEETFSNEVCLYIKNYAKISNGLSQHVHNLRIGNKTDDLTISGPIGIGLNLEQTLQGTNIVIAAGTGILPFIDYISFVLRYIVHRVNILIGLDDSNNSIDSNESFDDIDDNFKLIVFYSCAHESHTIFSDVMQKIADIDFQYNLNTFKYFLRISSNNKLRWNASYFGEKLSCYKNNLTKIFLVGPIEFMSNIQGYLLEEDICEKNKIFWN